MHLHRYRSTLRGLKFGALHFIFNTLLMWVMFSALIFGLIIFDLTIVYCGVGCIAMWVISSLWFALKAQSIRCPICLVPLFANKGCSKNKKAKKLLGSYRLPVSGSILCCGHYRCPYCGEKFNVSVSKQSQVKV